MPALAPFWRKGWRATAVSMAPTIPLRKREMFGLGKVLAGEGDYAQAEQLFADVRVEDQRAYGPRHPNTIYDENQLGLTYVRRQDRPGYCFAGASAGGFSRDFRT